MAAATYGVMLPETDVRFLANIISSMTPTLESSEVSLPNTNTNAIRRKQKKIRTNNLSCKTQRFDYFEYTKMNDFLNNTEEISDFNNLASTLESESIKQRNEPFDVEKLCDEFKNSALRSTFIIDYDGNNYVNFEQKKIIEDYFDKKKNLENNINKCKINTIKVQEYHTNDISSKGIINDCLYSQNLNKIKNINIQSNNNNINNVNKKRKIPLKFVPFGNRLGIGRRMLSTKINQNIKILLNQTQHPPNNQLVGDSELASEAESPLCRKHHNTHWGTAYNQKDSGIFYISHFHT